jgi:hypothetical protein
MRASLARCWRATFEGDTRTTPFVAFRIGLSLLILLRTTNLADSWLALDHFRWTRGLEYLPAAEAVSEPRLFSPLLPLPMLSETWITALVHVRTGLAVALLVGLWPRLSALALFVIGYGLMALDRYRYFHHMHLLWTSCLWIALLPTVRSVSLSACWSGSSQQRAPRWALSLLRAQALIIYLAAGLAKLQPSWLSGAALDAAARAGLVGGALWETARDLLGIRGVASLLALSELSIVLLLSLRRARPWGIALGIALHVGLEESMLVSTFGAQMVLYLLMFLPWSNKRPVVTGVAPPRHSLVRRARYSARTP